MNDETIRVGGFYHGSVVDGPGIRNVLFVQGCRHGCPGCHNPWSHDPDGGTSMPVPKIVSALTETSASGGARPAITISGGEPFDQQAGVTALLRELKALGADIWAYTGYVWDKVAGSGILRYVDVLVDGPYMEGLRCMGCLFVGSANQRTIDVQASLRLGAPVLWKHPALAAKTGELGVVEKLMEGDTHYACRAQ